MVRITVSRYWRFFVVDTLTPVILSTLLAFCVLFIPTSAVSKRLGAHQSYLGLA